MQKLTKSLLENLSEGDLIYKYPFNSDEIHEYYNPEDAKQISPFRVKSITEEEVILTRIDPTASNLYNITLVYSIEKVINGQFWLPDNFKQN